MKRNALRILVGASALVLSASPAVWAQICRSSSQDCNSKDRSAMRCAVKVGLTGEKEECTVTSLDKVTDKREFPRHQVQACVGDTVTWTFESKCARDITVEIGSLRLTKEIIARHEKENPNIRTESRDLFSFGGLRSVLVRGGQSGMITGLVRAKYAPRTYKYDIIGRARDGKRVFLVDPEGEIYP